MKIIIRNFAVAVVVLCAFMIPAKALTITTTISSTTASTTQSMLLFPNESLTYSLTGTATGQLLIERSGNNSEWSPAGVTITGAGVVSSSGALYSGPSNTYYRIRRSTMTAGSLTTVLADVNDLVQEFNNNKKQRIMAINDDTVEISGGFIAGSSTFTLASMTNPTLTGAVTVASGSTVTYSGTIESGTITKYSTTTLVGAVVNGTKTDNSTTTYTGTNVFSGSTTITGTQTNDTAQAGKVGQYISTYNSLTGNLTSGQWLDVSTITLTAGDWIVSGLVSVAPQTTLPVFTRVQIGISSTAGNSAAGLNDGENMCDGFLPTSASNRGGASIPQYRVSLAATTPYYLKVNAAWTTDTVKALGRISATRVR